MVDGGKIEPCSGAFDGAFEVLGETAIAVKRRKGSLDHPAPRPQDEALGVIRTLDNLQRPLADPGKRSPQFVYGVSPVGKYVAQPWEVVADAGELIGNAASGNRGAISLR